MTPHRPASVAEEIGQSTPFRTKRQEAMVSLLRTADSVRRFLSDRMASRGLTLQQYNVLRILRGAGEDGVPTLAIADRMLERTPGVTRLVDRLVEKGLAERRRCTEDRRRVFCTITSQGRDLLSGVDAYVDGLDDQALVGLNESDADAFVEALDAIRAGLTALEVE